MSSNDNFRQIALSFAETTEVPHFEKHAFRSNKKIFATLIEESGLGVALLSQAEQYIFCKTDEKNIYPVPNKWGLKGATYLIVKNISKKLLKEILETAYQLSLQPAPAKSK
ncbi:MAG: MmcQ/YjbR family DNA-binding protein [Sphingobacteriales bacterium]|nr:MAG: MmcQ/YjbR family DNA-binding protein [Sphingobacteriales bacterium]